jgi:hypothetical protein
MDGLLILIGLIVWVFAIIGVMHLSKRGIGWLAERAASDPEGFKKAFGAGTHGPHAPVPSQPDSHRGVPSHPTPSSSHSHSA